MTGGLESGALWATYRKEVEGAVMTRSLGTAIFVLFVIQTGFVAVDFVIFPDVAVRFLPVRMALNLVLGWFYFRTRFTHPVGAMIGTCYCGGAMLLCVMFGTGASATQYYTGLVLLFVGMPVLVPISGRQAAAVVSVLLSVFLLFPVFSPREFEWRTFALSSFFLTAAAFESVMSSVLLDRVRFSDFSRRHELERARDELRELDRAKSRFTANIHHELRTPLTLVLAPLEAMLQGEFGAVSDSARQYLRTMQVNALRLLKLINNLLDLAKAESGQLTLKRRPMDPARVVADVAAGAAPMAERKQVRLVTAIEPGLPTLHADADALEKVVMNLLGNALKFTESGGTITIALRPAAPGEPEAGGVHLSVTDTGIGLPPEELGRIFDRFAQVDASATRKFEGTGIGLSLAKELTELHGGRIWAESPGLGHGATFHVTIPAGAPSDDEVMDEEVLTTRDGQGVALGRSLGALEAELNLEDEGALPAAAGVSAEAYRGAELARTVERWESAAGGDAPPAIGRITASDPTLADAPEVLVAEDNADMRRLLVHLLGREFRVRETRNGREALEAARERAPDLVLSDVMMPEMSGTDLCRALKGDPATRDVPFMLVTSKAEREMKIEGLELGADDYVTKPFHPRELIARVRALVRLHRLKATLAERNQALEDANRELARTVEELKSAEVSLVRAERLAAVGELAAGVAHEVNNPVNYALNALKMLRDRVDGVRRVAEGLTALDLRDPTKLAAQAEALVRLRDEIGLEETAAEVAELAQIAGDGLGRTQRLVGDLRELAGPRRGEPVSVDLVRGVVSTVQLVRHSLERAGVRIETRVADDLPRVRGDAGALSQVILNLLKNAADVLETAGGRIEVAAFAEGADVVVEVRDDGPGVSEAVRARLFEPFVSTKEAGRGSGLGLSICHRIVSEHGGTITLEASPEGSGAVFRVRLPAEERDAA
jgi:signal transduction histidine kinase